MTDAAAITRPWPQRASVARAGRAAMVGPGKGIGAQGVSMATGDLAGIITRTVGGANLIMAPDAGYLASYPGVGQTWIDTVGGNNLNLGASGSVGADDPVFNGIAGNLSANEKWTFDAAKLFTLAGANPPVIVQAHKNNALFTIIVLLNIVSFATPASAVSILGNYASPGFLVNIGTTIVTGTIGLAVEPLVFNARSTITVSLGWNLFAISMNEAAGAAGSLWWANKNAQTFDGTYSSPSASAPAGTFVAGAANSSLQQAMDGNWELGGFAILDTNLSAVQLDAIYDAFKAARPSYGLA